MPTIDFGKVKGDNGASMRTRGAWTPSTEYKNDEQYIDIVTNGGSSYSCKTTHTSGTTFSSENWNLIAQKGDKGDKGDKGNNGITPTITAGTATSLASTASPTVTATTNGNTTTFNFGIPKGDISEVKTPTFDDSVGTYTTLSAANNAAETASNAIKSKVSIFTTLSNAKKSFSAIVQGLKILATNVGAINGITDSLTSTSSNVAASAAAVKALNDKTTQLNSNLMTKRYVVGSSISNSLEMFRVGNVVFLNASFQINKDVAWGDIVVSNLPSELCTNGYFFGIIIGNGGLQVNKNQIQFKPFTTIKSGEYMTIILEYPII